LTSPHPGAMPVTDRREDPRVPTLPSDATGADPVTTIRDVAQLAGVSTMTVSRVINRSGYASEAVRRRVDRAVAELGYVPNAVARQLRSKRTRTIALVVSDITNPFFTVVARGVEDAARGRDHAVIFVNTDESQTLENDYLRILMGRRVDGVLLVPAGNSAEPFRLLRSQKIPVVVLDRRVQVRQVDEVRCDSEAGAYALVGHLIGLGHAGSPPVGVRNPDSRSDRPLRSADVVGPLPAHSRPRRPHHRHQQV
jgi:DNA-binding LacI/PurR family transcriptional regulator